MKKDEKMYGRVFQLKAQIKIHNHSTEKQPNTYLIESNIENSPELQLVMANTIASYAREILKKESKRHKSEREFTNKERGNISATVAFMEQIIYNQAPILYSDLKFQAMQEEEEKAKNNKATEIVIASQMGSI